MQIGLAAKEIKKNDIDETKKKKLDGGSFLCNMSNTFAIKFYRVATIPACKHVRIKTRANKEGGKDKTITSISIWITNKDPRAIL